MESTSKIISQSIEQLPNGAVFAPEDLITASIEPNYLAIMKSLSYKEKKNEIIRVRKGLYFKPYTSTITNFRIMQASQNDIVQYFIKKNEDNAYITGFVMFNILRLTEQMSQSITIAMDNPHKNFDDYRVYFVKSKYPVTAENKHLLQLLDCLENINNIPEISTNEVYQKLLFLHFSKLNDDELNNLARISKLYNSQTRLLLSNIFKQLKKDDLSFSLRKSIVFQSYKTLKV